MLQWPIVFRINIYPVVQVSNRPFCVTLNPMYIDGTGVLHVLLIVPVTISGKDGL